MWEPDEYVRSQWQLRDIEHRAEQLTRSGPPPEPSNVVAPISPIYNRAMESRVAKNISIKQAKSDIKCAICKAGIGHNREVVRCSKCKIIVHLSPDNSECFQTLKLANNGMRMCPTISCGVLVDEFISEHEFNSMKAKEKKCKGSKPVDYDNLVCALKKAKEDKLEADKRYDELQDELDKASEACDKADVAWNTAKRAMGEAMEL